MSVPAVLNALFQIPDFLSAKSSTNKFKQEFQQLGQDLQSGNLANAQPAYASLQQEFAQLGSALSTSSTSTSSASSNALNVTA